MPHTRICDLLRIEHPILNAPMAGTAGEIVRAMVAEAERLLRERPGQPLR